MLKKVSGKKLGRSRTALLALLRSQTRSLVANGYIRTTKSKAQVVRDYVEKLCTKARKDTVAGRRELMAELANDRVTADKLIMRVAKLERKSGFTRMIKLPARGGDNAEMARLEWVDALPEPKVEKEKGKKRASKEEKKDKK